MILHYLKVIQSVRENARKESTLLKYKFCNKHTCNIY